VANDPSTQSNFVFSATRDFSGIGTLSSGIHDPAQPAEQLLSLAIDPKAQLAYIGTDHGNLFRRNTDGTITQLIHAPDGAPAMLGLELAPRGSFCAPVPDPCLVATTDAGTVIVIDLTAPALDDVIRTQPGHPDPDNPKTL